MPQLATEVFAFGKVPLAMSARCYHARAHKLTKDNCRFVCEKDPDGMPVKTLDGAGFRFQPAGNELREGRLAVAVRAEQRDAVVIVDAQVDLLQDRAARCVADGAALDGDDR